MHAPYFALFFTLCVARALDGAAGGGQEKVYVKFWPSRPAQDMHPFSPKIYTKLFYLETNLKLFYALMCRILRLDFFTYCSPPVLSLFGPASPCWLNPPPEA